MTTTENSARETYQPVGLDFVPPAQKATPAPLSPSGSASPHPSRHILLRAALAIFGAAAGLLVLRLALNWWSVGRWTEVTDDAYVGGEVTVIAPKVSGLIGSVAVVDNQRVKAGDLLVRIDDRDYRAALAKASAAVAMQEASLSNLEANRRLQEAIVAQAQAVIAAAEAEIVRTREDRTRYADLLKQSAVSVQESQRREAEHKSALAVGERSRAGLLAAERQLDVIETQKLQVAAALEQARAERQLAELNLGYTELRAPIDGIVGNRNARVGAYAAVGTQLIALVPQRGLWVDANFKEGQLARIRPGMPVKLKVDSIPGRVLQGRVQSIAPATGAQFSLLPPENATGNFTKIVQRVPVRILLDDDATLEDHLRPGLSVIAKIITKGK